MSGALTIGMFRADCEVAADATAAAAFGDSASRALRDHTAAGLRTSLEGWVDGPDESVWIVRRLELGVVVDVATTADALGSEIARGLKAALTRALADDGDGSIAIRFAGRDAYLARFVREIIEGDPWRLWYFAPLAGLKLLGRSAAIAAALTARPELARRALATLDDRTLDAVARTLSVTDTNRVLQCLDAAADAASAPSHDVVRAACVACTHAVVKNLSSGAGLFAVVRAPAAVNPRSLRDAAETILAATASVSADRTDVRLQVLERIAAAADANDPAEPLADLVARCVRAATAVAAPGRTSSAVAQPLTPAVAGDGQIVSTPFGGAVLLLRDVDQLPWDLWTRGWPDLGGAHPAAVLKWATLALAAGGDRSRGFVGDSAWRCLFGLPRELTLDALAAWGEAVGSHRRKMLARDVSSTCGTAAWSVAERGWYRAPRRCAIDRRWTAAIAPVARNVVHAFARRLPGFADSTPSFLWQQVLSAEASMEFAADRVIVRYGRVPLHLLLTLTGMTRGLEAGRDALDRPIVVFQAD